MASSDVLVLRSDGRQLMRVVIDAATPPLRVNDLLDDLNRDGLKGHLALTADGSSWLQGRRAVSAGDVYYFVETSPPEDEWYARHNAIRAKYSPSQLAKSLSELLKELGTDDPIYNLGRTSGSTTPLVLAVEPFACYARLFRSHLPTTRDWEFVIEILDKMSTYYMEEARQQAVALSLNMYLTSSCRGMRFRIREAKRGERLPDVRIEAEIGGEWILVAILDVKPEIGFYGDPAVETTMYYAEYTLNKRAVYHWAYQLSCCPVLAMELAGPTIRVGGLAHFTDKPAHEPFTPFLHMLKFLRDQEHLDVLARALTAIPATIQALVRFYTALNSQVSQGRRLSTRLHTVDYPFRIMSLGAAEVRRFSRLGVQSALLRQLGVGSQQQLLFHIRLPSGEQRIIKFCQRYGSDVHKLWAESGHAPSFRHEALDGGWFFIDMEFLSPEDGWVLLTELDPGLAVQDPNAGNANQYRLGAADWETCKKRVKDAHQAVHAKHPETVHGDLRQQNIFYNVRSFRVSFVDFDWAGDNGLQRYPLWLNWSITWPAGVKSAAVMFAEHDQQLLDSELA